MQFQKIEYIERKTGEKKTEKVPGEKFLKFLYYNPFGKLALDLLVKRKFLTAIYGKIMSTNYSKKNIKPFIESLNIDMNESDTEIENFKNFNEFFYRKLKKSARPINYDENVIISPADGKILIYENISELNKFYIKGQEFSLKTFLDDEELAKKYDGGIFAVVRLCPADYHRLHFVADGKISESKLINGYYYSVSTHAIRKNFNIFLENKREISILSTEKFGDIAMIEIAATMVGGITQVYEKNSFVKKGEEKSYFSFGGSSIVLLFEKNRVIFDSDLIENTKNNIETKIYMGEKIAYAK